MSQQVTCSPLPDTLTPAAVQWSQEDDKKNLVPVIWGVLSPRRTYFQTLELKKDKYMIGRGESCDVRITKENLGQTCANALNVISKIHFSVIRENSLTYVEDLSRNGTFLNGELVGRGNRFIIQNDDEISIGHRTLKVYVYQELHQHLYSNLKDEYPVEVRSKYILSKVIGRGAFGEVRLCYAKRTSKRYAIKTVKYAGTEKIFRHNRAQNRIENEVKILKALQHPCIISLIEVFTLIDSVHIVMEYMEGGELYQKIMTDGCLPEQIAKLYYIQILTAVKFLHDEGVTHRDLKPENILLQTNNKRTLVKIADFGLSKFIDKESILKTICGTPLYVAPEILKTNGHGKYTQQVDIWSLGVLLYFCLSGQVPFNPLLKTPLNIQIVKGEYSFNDNIWEEISAEAKHLVTRMLTIDPEKRIDVNDILKKHKWITEDTAVQKEAECLMIEDSEVTIDASSGSEYSTSAVKKQCLEDLRLSNVASSR